MNIYKLFKMAGSGKIPNFAKLLGLWALHVSGRRYIGVFFDPVLACNLRCRMCYFSNPQKRRAMSGVADIALLELVERVFFPRALKLQIGCGAEPTLYGSLDDIVVRARRAGVPYISLVTNGQLLVGGRVDIARLVALGLDELTLSMHGTRHETYQELMRGADFEKLKALLRDIARVKAEHPGFRLRVNFTVNSMNVHDLEGDNFWAPWPDGLRPDILQLRPVQDIGSTDWCDYDPAALAAVYDSTFGNLIAYCHANGITCIAPTAGQINEVATPQDGVSALIEDVTYCYISPGAVYKDDFDADTDTFASYHRRAHTARRLLKAALFKRVDSRDKRASKKLNYKVE